MNASSIRRKIGFPSTFKIPSHPAPFRLLASRHFPGIFPTSSRPVRRALSLPRLLHTQKKQNPAEETFSGISVPRIGLEPTRYHYH